MDKPLEWDLLIAAFVTLPVYFGGVFVGFLLNTARWGFRKGWHDSERVARSTDPLRERAAK